MAVVTHGGTLPDSAQKTDFYGIVDNATVTGIVDADCSNSMALANSKLAQITTAGKVSGAALTALGSVPNGSTALPTGSGGTGSTSNANAASGVVVLDASSKLPAVDGSQLTNLPSATKVSTPFVKCTNSQTSGTAGGTASTGSWTTAVLNTKNQDTGSIATLSSNQVSIPSGTYRVRASIPFHKVGGAQSRLYNVTDSAILTTGTSVNQATSTSGVECSSLIDDVFTLSGTKSVALQYFATSTTDTNDLGVAASTGTTEVYAMLVLEKTA